MKLNFMHKIFKFIEKQVDDIGKLVGIPQRITVKLLTIIKRLSFKSLIF